jgi:hypothetical protein
MYTIVWLFHVILRILLFKDLHIAKIKYMFILYTIVVISCYYNMSKRLCSYYILSQVTHHKSARIQM